VVTIFQVVVSWKKRYWQTIQGTFATIGIRKIAQRMKKRARQCFERICMEASKLAREEEKNKNKKQKTKQNKTKPETNNRKTRIKR
jgi:hypothetical protein